MVYAGVAMGECFIRIDAYGHGYKQMKLLNAISFHWLNVYELVSPELRPQASTVSHEVEAVQGCSLARSATWGSGSSAVMSVLAIAIHHDFGNGKRPMEVADARFGKCNCVMFIYLRLPVSQLYFHPSYIPDSTSPS